MSFFQDPPRLGNQFDDDRLLRRYLDAILPPDALAEMEPSLREMGELASGRLFELASRHRLDEPVHVPFDAWGRRVDEIEVNAAWQEYADVAARHGLVAVGYERHHGAYSRVHQFALVYLFAPSSQTYTCPLAMTDGCARTLELLGSPELRERVLSRLVSRDPGQVWTSGQWMTERIGGSDVGATETIAKRGDDGRYRLYGAKWFTSAVTSEVALTLARPDENRAGGKGLALFLVHLRDASGQLNGIVVNRLKDKLGTRHLPTAELTLDGTVAEPVAGLSDGIRHMSAMLNLTRTWNAVCAVAGMRRGLALARDYASRRRAFGAPLSEKPLHLDTLADLSAEHEAAFHLAFYEALLLGRSETGDLAPAKASVLRALQVVAKLFTARAAVRNASEVLECFGGAGYVEDTGLPALLRDAQVLPIWEGTTNVLSLETIRALTREDGFRPFAETVHAHAGAAAESSLVRLGRQATEAVDHAMRWVMDAASRSQPEVEAGARRFALTLGASLALALMVEHAQGEFSRGDRRAAAAARRFARCGVDYLDDNEYDAEQTAALALGDPLG